MTTLRYIYLLFLFIAAYGCANTKIEPTQIPREEKTQSQILMELASLDGQIANVDGMIANASARLQSYQAADLPNKSALIAGAESERESYESQKMLLLAKKQALQLKLTSGD